MLILVVAAADPVQKILFNYFAIFRDTGLVRREASWTRAAAGTHGPPRTRRGRPFFEGVKIGEAVLHRGEYSMHEQIAKICRAFCDGREPPFLSRVSYSRQAPFIQG
jgi:hypothetical protein